MSSPKALWGRGLMIYGLQEISCPLRKTGGGGIYFCLHICVAVVVLGSTPSRGPHTSSPLEMSPLSKQIIIIIFLANTFLISVLDTFYRSILLFSRTSCGVKSFFLTLYLLLLLLLVLYQRTTLKNLYSTFTMIGIL